MPGVLMEEKGNYGIDCRNAIWASDGIHAIYHSCGLPQILCDADFVIENEDIILLVEYKNANTPEARAHASALDGKRKTDTLYFCTGISKGRFCLTKDAAKPIEKKTAF